MGILVLCCTLTSLLVGPEDDHEIEGALD
jgi:hypothetical protein